VGKPLVLDVLCLEVGTSVASALTAETDRQTDGHVLSQRPVLAYRRTGKNREEGNGKPSRLFSLDMIPIDGCFEDVLQLWPLFFDVNCRLPSDGSHGPAVRTAEYQKKKKKMIDQ